MSFESQQAFRDLSAIVAERTNPLLIWVGAGLSVPAGVPSWADLRDRLVTATLERADQLTPVSDGDRLRRIAEKAGELDDLWLAFELLEKHGRTSFRETVRSALAPAQTAQVPRAYELIWKLRARGVLTLNLDRLASRALSFHLGPGIIPPEKSGLDLGRLRQVVKGHQQWVGNLHGTAEDSDSWVFTKPKLDELLSNRPYRAFIELCFSAYTIIFLGITADDRAVGGQLEALDHEGVDVGTHFWLTDKSSYDNDQWAQRVGISSIYYDSSAGHGAVDTFLEQLIAAQPADDAPAPPVLLDRSLAESGEVPEDPLPDEAELSSLPTEDIRRRLNAHAVRILAESPRRDYAEYEAFLVEYTEAIHRAWFTDTKPGRNNLLGYVLNREVNEGAFGRVYEATAPNGEQVAVKVLRQVLSANSEALHAFRRGVNSMRILSQRGLDGMVEYREASEIPPFVVMEWVDGPNLQQAREINWIDDWYSILRVATGLTHTLRAAHQLPERVLHRDVRPANIMLSDMYTDRDNWEVRVLDFDLSWHRDAHEKSVLHTTSAGYLAPEQIQRIPGASTRSAAVDSFGVGMTLFFMCSGRDPLPDEHRHRDWESTVITACSSLPSDWKSLPARYARLVLATTADSQSQRWDLAEVQNELRTLTDALTSPDSVPTEFTCEEIAARSQHLTDYQWDPDRLEAVRQTPSGLLIRLRADPTAEQIEASLEWTSTGEQNRTGLAKYVQRAGDRARKQLGTGGWVGVQVAADKDAVQVRGHISGGGARAAIDALAAAVDSAAESLKAGA